MHGLAYNAIEGIRIVGVCDVHEERARTLGRRLGVPSYTELGSLLRDHSPDLASVCTREWQHRDTIMSLLSQQIDIFAEKILATRLAHAREIRDAVAKSGRKVGVNYNYRFMPGVVEIKRICESGELGVLRTLDIVVHAFSYHHALDLMCFLGGPPTSVTAALRIDNRERPFGGTDWSLYDSDIPYVPNAAAVTLRFATGALGTVNSTYEVPPESFILSILAQYDAGAVCLNGINAADVVGNLSILKAGRAIRPDPRRFPGRPFARGYEYCFSKSIESFVSAYAGGSSVSTSDEWGLAMIELERSVSWASRNLSAIEVNVP